MLIPAQLEAETTDASTDPSPFDIGATYIAVRQHEEELEMERVEMLKEEERGVEKQKEMSEREVERRETDAGEQEGIEEIKNEVRDPAPSPTAHAAANARPHEPARSDWAAEVDEAMGLSPVVHNTSQPEPVNPVPGEVTVDPIRTAFANAAPADSVPIPTSPVPVDPAPVNPVAIDPVRTARRSATSPIPFSHAPTDPAPTNLVHSDVTVGPVRTTPVDPNPNPVNLNLSDAATDATPPAFSSAVPAVPVPINPISAPVKPDPEPTALVDPIPCDVAIDPIRTALASAVPVDPDPDLVSPIYLNLISVKPTPVKLIRIKFCNLTSVVLRSHTDYTPTDIFTDRVPINSVHIKSIPVNSVPIDHVHVDPVSVTTADLNLITAAITFIGFTFITHFGHQTHLPNSQSHLHSISLALVKVFGVF